MEETIGRRTSKTRPTPAEHRAGDRERPAGSYHLGRGRVEPERVQGLRNDRRAVRQVLAGDRDRFNSLITRYWGPVFRLALRMVKDHGEAEDLTQQTFLEAYQDLPRYDQQRAFHSWLMRIATNNCRDFLKRSQRKEFPSGDSGEFAAAMFRGQAPSPEQHVATGRRISQMLRAVDQMPRKYGIPLVLKEMEDLSYQEIQRVTDVSQGALRQHVRRARRQLRETLKKQEKGD